MKKLMIVLGAIAMAVGAQAAAVTWNWNGTFYDGWKNDGGASTYTPAAQSGTMYIFNANTVGRQAVLTALLNGTDISKLSSMDNYTTSNGKMVNSAKKTLAADYKTFTPVRSDSGTDYADYFYAMVDEEYIYISEAFSTGICTTQDTPLKGSIGTGSQNYIGATETVASTGGWYTAVPEPTSGLLLLLGMAGLALKRKRA